MTACELAVSIARDNPTRKFAYTASDCAVGVWNAELDRYQVLCGRLITGGFARMPVEILVNGKTMHSPSDWIAL